MERSPFTISPRKFAKLPIARRHELIGEMAERSQAGQVTAESFWERYDQLVTVGELDRYVPPFWLSSAEALEEVRHLHLLLAGVEPSEGLAEAPACSWQPRFAMTVALEQVRSPYNLGSLLRLIDNFGFEGLVHASRLYPGDHPRFRRAARGCQAWIPVQRTEDLLAWLAASGRSIIAIEDDPRAVELTAWQPPNEGILLLGNETYGLSAAVRACCTQLVRIPMFGYKKSMNVSHAFAVVAQHIVTQQAGTAIPK